MKIRKVWTVIRINTLDSKTSTILSLLRTKKEALTYRAQCYKGRKIRGQINGTFDGLYYKLDWAYLEDQE